MCIYGCTHELKTRSEKKIYLDRCFYISQMKGRFCLRFKTAVLHADSMIKKDRVKHLCASGER